MPTRAAHGVGAWSSTVAVDTHMPAMNGAGPRASYRHRLSALIQRLIGIADEPTDDDDLRLRKRVGVVAGWIGVVLPFQLPGLAQGHPLSWWVALTMPLVSPGKLAVLARTRRFDRYVVILVLTFMLMPAFVEVALGGLAGSSANIVFAFLGPVYAILALGPRRATAWFMADTVMEPRRHRVRGVRRTCPAPIEAEVAQDHDRRCGSPGIELDLRRPRGRTRATGGRSGGRRTG